MPDRDNNNERDAERLRVIIIRMDAQKRKAIVK
jgi:hypothetical protein